MCATIAHMKQQEYAMYAKTFDKIKPKFKGESKQTSIHMAFNPGLNQVQKVIFSWKMTKLFHSQVSFNIYYLQKFYLNKKENLYYHIQ